MNIQRMPRILAEFRMQCDFWPRAKTLNILKGVSNAENFNPYAVELL